MANTLFFDGDVGATLEFTVLKADGTAYNLTGGTVQLIVEGVDEFDCTLITPSEGRADKVVSASEFPTGTYRAQLRTTVAGVILHTPAFNLQVGHVLDTPVVVVPDPTGVPTEGAIPFGDTGGGTYTEDPTHLAYDNTNNVLKLGLGASMGSPLTDFVKLGVVDLNGAGTAGLSVMTEAGGGLHLADGTGSLRVLLAVNPILMAGGNNVAKLLSATSSLGVYDSLMVGDPDAVPGTSGAKVIVQKSGTAPTTSPADVAQTWVEDLDGAGTAGTSFRDETGHVHKVGRVISTPLGTSTTYAKLGGTFHYSGSSVGTPANTVETILHSINLPVGSLPVDGTSVRFYYFGALAANGNNKTIKLHISGIGGNVIVDSGTIATNNATWAIDGTITRTSSSVVSAQGVLRVGAAGAATGAVSVHRWGATSVTSGSLFDSPITLDLSGQNGSASANDVTCAISRGRYDNF